MRKLSLLILMGLVLVLPVTAQTSYILTASPSNVQTVVNSHGLTVVKELFDHGEAVAINHTLDITRRGGEDIAGLSHNGQAQQQTQRDQ